LILKLKNCHPFADPVSMIAFAEDETSDLFFSSPTKKVIPIAGGKGGVGKTLLSANLAIALASKGKRVIAVDLDLGASNLHSALGLSQPKKGLGSFFSENGNQTNDLTPYLSPTPYPHLSLLPGDLLIPDLAELSWDRREKLISALFKLEADFLIIDLGAGSHPLTCDLMMMSAHPILVLEPSPLAAQNAYSLMRTAVYRALRKDFYQDQYFEIFEAFNQKKEGGTSPTLWDLLNELAHLDSEGVKSFKLRLEKIRPQLFLNRVHGAADVSILKDLIHLLYQKAILDPEILGYLSEDPNLYRSMIERKPFLNQWPEARASKMIFQVANYFAGA
jgi:flagellar biosynthesis protein FlhG